MKAKTLERMGYHEATARKRIMARYHNVNEGGAR